ncbi:Uncharacterized protein Rs2_03443 [Raphanus sativus]|nr:Uncharacterized protein Rs2_03443 [Raphanus sativus]
MMKQRKSLRNDTARFTFYELMPNVSLESHLHGSSWGSALTMTWPMKMKIALDIARPIDRKYRCCFWSSVIRDFTWEKPVEKLGRGECESIITWAMLYLTDRTKLPNVTDCSVFFVFTMAPITISQLISLSPDSGKVTNAAVASIFEVTNRELKIDPSDASAL